MEAQEQSQARSLPTTGQKPCECLAICLRFGPSGSMLLWQEEAEEKVMTIDEILSEGKPTGGLTKWFKEKWVNIAKKEGGKHPACGTSGDTRGYAKCVPAKKAASMSAKDKKSAVNRKRSAQRRAGRPGRASGSTGKAPIRVSTDKE